MRDVLEDLIGWWQAGETVGMGTVVATWRSAPRPAGASMLVGPDGTAVGSVSGGCVEGAVYEEAKDVVETGVPTLERYGVSDDDAFAVGLTCGGILDAFVETGVARVVPRVGEIAESVGRQRAGRRRHLGAGPGGPARPPAGDLVLTACRGRWGLQRLDDAVAADARGMLAAGRTAMLGLRPRRRAARRRPEPVRATSFARRRGWWCSARSTSPPPSRGSAPSSATG